MDSTEMNDGGYSAKRTAEIVDITYRQLDYWARTDLVKPTLATAAGSGTRRRYSYRDLLALKVVKTLLDAGIHLKKVRAIFDFVGDSLDEDVANLQFVISGETVLASTEEHAVIDLGRGGQGVLLLNTLPLDALRDELDATIIELFPGEEAATAADDAAAVGE